MSLPALIEVASSSPPRKRGRPRMPPTKVVSIRLTPELATLYLAASAESGRPFRSILREIVTAHAPLEESLAPIPFISYRRRVKPIRRIRKIEIAEECRARRLGIEWERVDLQTVYEAYGGLCGICRKEVSLELFTIDHIVPISNGGAHVVGNLQPAHSVCNSRKGAKFDAT